MKIVALMPARNEAWVLGMSARVALAWCDELIILNHASTDETAQIACELEMEYPGRCFVACEENRKWDEMQHRQSLLLAAREREATHIAVIDADEILTANLVGKIRDKVEQHGAPGWMLYLPGFNLRGSAYEYHANGIWGQRWFSIVFAEDPRLYWSGDTFHRREPQGRPMFRQMQLGSHLEGGVLHLWGASERRLIAKHALYKVTERLRWPQKAVALIEQTYDMAFRPGAEPAFAQDWRFAEVPAEWWAGHAHLQKYLDVDREPWQEAEVRRLVAEHGAATFAGLNLFGLVEAAKAVA